MRGRNREQRKGGSGECNGLTLPVTVLYVIFLLAVPVWAAAAEQGEEGRESLSTIITNTTPQKLVADFTTNVRTGIAPLTILFSDNSQGIPMSWDWDFDGDGLTDSTAPNPIWTYQLPGNYSVRLKVENAVATSEIVRKDLINVIGPSDETALVAEFTGSPITGPAPLTVVFSDLSKGFVTNWAWDMNNDGTPDSYAPNPIWTFEKPGNYTIRLVVSNGKQVSEQVKERFISVSEGAGPAGVEADFTATPRSGPAPLTVVFSDLSKGFVTSWAWDFDNDGKIDNMAPNPIWSYERPGNYTVRLVAGNAQGTTTIIKENFVNVSAGMEISRLKANFGAYPTAGPAPLMVVFSDLSTGIPSNWAWDLDGDNLVDSTVPNPLWVYQSPGNYTVRLTVANAEGMSEFTRSEFIHVSGGAAGNSLKAEFSANPTSGPAPLTVVFSDLSTGIPSSWAWDLDGDGRIDSTVPNPIWRYETPGNYTVQLTVGSGVVTNTTVKTTLVQIRPAEPWWYAILSLIPGLGFSKP